MRPLRVLVVEPSGRGALASYTDLVSAAIVSAGAQVVLLGPVTIVRRPRSVPLSPTLPEPWAGADGGLSGGHDAVHRLRWVRAVLSTRRAARLHDPDVIHFQAPLAGGADPALIRLLQRHRPVVWTAHDVIPAPAEGGGTQQARFRDIYRTVDAVIVHSEAAADELSALAGTKALVIDHPAPPSIPAPRGQGDHAIRTVPPPLPPTPLADIGRAHVGLYRKVATSAINLMAYTDAIGWGGAEESLATLLAHLPERVEATIVGVDREVVERIGRQRPGSPTVTLPPVRNKADIGPILAHAATVAGRRPAIFHANLWTPYACQYGIAAALVTPGVATIAVEQLPMETAHSFQLAVKRVTSRRLAAHVAVSEASAREIEELVQLPAGTVRTIYNGVTDLGPVDRLPGGPITIGATGRLVPQKGFDVLLTALADLPELRLLLVGDGVDRAALEEQARLLGVADRVEMVGWTDSPREHLARMDIFALPSRFEGFPLAIVEAMLAGLPVVSTKVSGIPEAVVDGETGLLVPPDDPPALAAAIRRLAVNEGLRRRLGEAGRARAMARFTAPAMAAAFVDLYDRVLRSSRRRTRAS